MLSQIAMHHCGAMKPWLRRQAPASVRSFHNRSRPIFEFRSQTRTTKRIGLVSSRSVSLTQLMLPESPAGLLASGLSPRRSIILDGVHPSLGYSSYHRTFSSLSTAKASTVSEDQDTNEAYLDHVFASPSVLLVNPWGNKNDINDPTSIDPLDCNVQLDQQSRFVLHLLQNLHQVGGSADHDLLSAPSTSSRPSIADYSYVSTERCNFIIRKLWKYNQDTTTNAANNNDQMHHPLWQRAERARLILEAMELFEEYRPLQQQSQDGSSPPLSFSLPLATHETYWNVLRLYVAASNEPQVGNNNDYSQHSIPQRCEAIVRRMEDSGRLELLPTSIHWNQVLAAHANTLQDPERPLKAATLLYELHSRSQGSSKVAASVVDESSFSHALRACIPQKSSTKKFSQLASAVSTRVWNALLKEVDTNNGSSNLKLQTFHMVHMLRTCQNFDSKDISKKSTLIQQVMDQAIQHQLVNIHVLQALFQVAPDEVITKYLGNSYPKDPAQAIQKVPSEWVFQESPTGGGSGGGNIQ